jgi:transcriptional regulator
MHTPRTFVETDLALLDALVAGNPFATLVTIGTDGAPFASHLPVLYRRDGDRVLVEGHWARPNPQARHGGVALAIIHGPDNYISASWYPDKAPAARVPTWNYAAAHLYGELEPYDDEAGLVDIVSRLSAHFEATVGEDWRFQQERDDHRRQVRGIVGFRFRPTDIQLKAKFSQNHPVGNREAVAAALERLDTSQSRKVAAMMRARIP